MKKLIILGWLSLSTTLFSIPGALQNFQIDEMSDHPSIPLRVLLATSLRSANLKSEFHNLYLKLPGQTGWTTFRKNVQIDASPAGTLVVDGSQLKSTELIVRGGPRFSDPIGFQTERYRGALRILVKDARLSIINIVPLEDYLVSTIGAEMLPSWELEALRSQAVASRSYALYRRGHPRSRNFDVENTTVDQVYRGVDSESVRARQAVESTEGQYLAFEGEPLRAFFHAKCGGNTETSKTVWNEKGVIPFRSVGCPYCKMHPNSWTHQVSLLSLAHSIGMEPTGRLALSSVERAPSGRLMKLKVFSDRGAAITLSGEELRGRLGYTRMKSALLDWKINGDAVQFFGKGHGHGVGMCQWGARYLAQLGKTYAEILAYYYPSTPLLRATTLKHLTRELPSPKTAHLW